MAHTQFMSCIHGGSRGRQRGRRTELSWRTAKHLTMQDILVRAGALGPFRQQGGPGQLGINLAVHRHSGHIVLIEDQFGLVDVEVLDALPRTTASPLTLAKARLGVVMFERRRCQGGAHSPSRLGIPKTFALLSSQLLLLRELWPTPLHP